VNIYGASEDFDEWIAEGKGGCEETGRQSVVFFPEGPRQSNFKEKLESRYRART
jgi:hypothetical protein